MIDKLINAIEKKNNPSVVGLDPTMEILPPYIINKHFREKGETPEALAEAFLEFNKGIIEAVKDSVPAVKPQIAMYEALGTHGIAAYIDTVNYAKEKGLMVIGDIKRGDIAGTAAAYATHIKGIQIGDKNIDIWKEDAVTINPYFGRDGIIPFIEAGRKKERGIFVLTKTSNPGSFEVQDLPVGNKLFYEKIAELVNDMADLYMGNSGYSNIGAVVGATHKKDGEKLRKLMPKIFFLIPGYGAQGATGQEIKGYFDKYGRGGIVNSSRGIMGAYRKEKYRGEDYREAAQKAVKVMKEDICRAIGI